MKSINLKFSMNTLYKDSYHPSIFFYFPSLEFINYSQINSISKNESYSKSLSKFFKKGNSF